MTPDEEEALKDKVFRELDRLAATYFLIGAAVGWMTKALVG